MPDEDHPTLSKYSSAEVMAALFEARLLPAKRPKRESSTRRQTFPFNDDASSNSSDSDFICSTENESENESEHGKEHNRLKRKLSSRNLNSAESDTSLSHHSSEADPPNHHEQPDQPSKQEEHLLPLHNVEIVARTVVKGQIAESTLKLLQDCCDEWLNFIVGDAGARVKIEGRRVVTCEDILESVSNLMPENSTHNKNHLSVLRLFLSKYREATVLASRGVLPDGPLQHNRTNKLPQLQP